MRGVTERLPATGFYSGSTKIIMIKFSKTPKHSSTHPQHSSSSSSSTDRPATPCLLGQPQLRRRRRRLRLRRRHQATLVEWRMLVLVLQLWVRAAPQQHPMMQRYHSRPHCRRLQVQSQPPLQQTVALSSLYLCLSSNSIRLNPNPTPSSWIGSGSVRCTPML